MPHKHEVSQIAPSETEMTCQLRLPGSAIGTAGREPYRHQPATWLNGALRLSCTMFYSDAGGPLHPDLYAEAVLKHPCLFRALGRSSAWQIEQEGDLNYPAGLIRYQPGLSREPLWKWVFFHLGLYFYSTFLMHNALWFLPSSPLLSLSLSFSFFT